jgi:hypothetical protein
MMDGNKNNNSNHIALAVVLSFVIGFGIATGAYFVIFCEDCFEDGTEIQKNPQDKCIDDPRCIKQISEDSGIEAIGTLIGEEKSRVLQELVRDPIIQNALKSANQKDSKMSDDIRAQIYVQREKEWTASQTNTPFMNSIIENDVSDFLRNNLVIESDEFVVTFGEHILTNEFGPNIAVSIKTDNYDQSQDEWWRQSYRDIDGQPFARECEFDSSAGIFSEDLVIKIHDEDGNFIGILNSATPCDVTLKSAEQVSKIEPVPLDNITPIGNYKISYLQELVKNPTIQNILESSNQEFSSMNEQDLAQLKEDTKWPRPGTGEPTAFQQSILENNASDHLRENLVVNSKEYGQIQFPEMILTNAKGATISSTDRTYNYIQTNDEWWQVASQNDVLVRQCGPDKSINMNSEDIIIKIFDDRGEFIGILNSATPCNVILNKPLFFYGDSN